MGLFHCIPGAAGISVLSIEPSVRCHVPGGTYEKILPYAYISLLAYAVGVPLSFGALLFRFRCVLTKVYVFQAFHLWNQI